MVGGGFLYLFVISALISTVNVNTVVQLFFLPACDLELGLLYYVTIKIKHIVLLVKLFKYFVWSFLFVYKNRIQIFVHGHKKRDTRRNSVSAVNYPLMRPFQHPRHKMVQLTALDSQSVRSSYFCFISSVFKETLSDNKILLNYNLLLDPGYIDHNVFNR